MGGHATADADTGRGYHLDFFQDQIPEEVHSDSAKHEREAEFLTFQQGNLTVQAYTDRFEYLARFYLPTVTEEWRCMKYDGGLKHELRRFIVPLHIREFSVLVE